MKARRTPVVWERLRRPVRVWGLSMRSEVKTEYSSPSRVRKMAIPVAKTVVKLEGWWY